MTLRAHAVRVSVRLQGGVNDPQGNTVREALHALGHAEVLDVRVGKVIDLLVEAESASAALRRAERMCQELLANPVIETFEAEVIGTTEGAGVAEA